MRTKFLQPLNVLPLMYCNDEGMTTLVTASSNAYVQPSARSVPGGMVTTPSTISGRLANTGEDGEIWVEVCLVNGKLGKNVGEPGCHVGLVAL